MMHTPITALVLAGRRAHGQDPLAGINVPHKALLEFAGKPMIRSVLTALAQAPQVGRIIIAAPSDIHDQLRSAAGDIEIDFIPAQASPAASITAGLDAVGGDAALLVTTCDHALLLPQMVSSFMSGAQTSGADVAAACVTQSDYAAAFGDAPRTFVRLSDFVFSGANLFLINPPRGRGLITFWTRLEANRKKPLTMAKQLGLWTGLRYLMGRLSKAAALDVIEAKTGARCALIALSDASAAVDVDKPADIALVQSVLEQRAKSRQSARV